MLQRGPLATVDQTKDGKFQQRWRCAGERPRREVWDVVWRRTSFKDFMPKIAMSEVSNATAKSFDVHMIIEVPARHDYVIHFTRDESTCSRRVEKATSRTAVGVAGPSRRPTASRWCQLGHREELSEHPHQHRRRAADDDGRGERHVGDRRDEAIKTRLESRPPPVTPARSEKADGCFSAQRSERGRRAAAERQPVPFFITFTRRALPLCADGRP